MRPIPGAAVDLVKRFESCRLRPYMDAANVWTIGWGHAMSHEGKLLIGMADRDIALAMYPSGMSQEDADDLLVEDMKTAADDVEAIVAAELSEGEYAALISFVFNLGIEKVRGSTLFKLLNGGDRKGAADALLEWIYAGDRILRGLVRRRVAERDLFLGQA